MENEILKQTISAQIAGQVVREILKQHTLDSEIIDRTVKITKGIVDGLYA